MFVFRHDYEEENEIKYYRVVFDISFVMLEKKKMYTASLVANQKKKKKKVGCNGLSGHLMAALHSKRKGGAVLNRPCQALQHILLWKLKCF